MKRADLTSQFMIYISITLIGVIGMMNFWFYHDHVRHLSESLEQNASAKLDFLEASAGYYLSHFENELIVELGEKTMLADEKVIFLSIENADGISLFENGDFGRKDSKHYTRQISDNGIMAGMIGLSMNTHEMMVQRHYAMLYAIGLMVLSVLLISVMIYLFYRKKILFEFDRFNREQKFLRDKHDFFTTIINTASNMVVVLDRHGHVALANQAYADMLNVPSETLIGEHVARIMDFECGGLQMREILNSSKAENFESFSEHLLKHNCKSILHNEAEEIHTEWKFSQPADTNGHSGYLVGSGVDMTHQHHKQLELRYRANHDHLTALPNRTLFNDRLQETFKRAKRNDSVFSLLFIDLDHFKPINDKYGHDAGDLVLKIVSQRMSSAIREVDTVARIGGDEFGVLLIDVKNRDNIYSIADKLLGVISEPIIYGDDILHVGASIGIALYSNNQQDAMELIRQADTAMYKAKENGRSKHCCFEEGLKLVSVRKLNQGS